MMNSIYVALPTHSNINNDDRIILWSCCYIAYILPHASHRCTNLHVSVQAIITVASIPYPNYIHTDAHTHAHHKVKRHKQEECEKREGFACNISLKTAGSSYITSCHMSNMPKQLEASASYSLKISTSKQDIK